MTSFLSKALSSLLKEHEELISFAKEIGDVAAHRWHNREEIRDIARQERRWEYRIIFTCEEDLHRFDSAIRGLVDSVLGDKA